MNYLNCSNNPTDIQDEPWIWEKKEINDKEMLMEYMDTNYELVLGAQSYKDGRQGYFIIHHTDGKWMLFYDKKKIDEKWKLVKQLYRDGKLLGVTQMKCSTISKNQRASDGDSEVIIIYCEPEKNEEHIKNIGKNIMELMEYGRSMYYKTNSQTKEGTRATGKDTNFKYSISYSVTNYILSSSSDED